MELPLNVLILEDRPADAELMVDELRKVGFAPQWQRVDTEGDYLAALDPGLDLILADHSLPQYDSIRALARLQERGLDIPFIIVSGTIGEGLAVSLMKKGAADYVWKDRMARLGQAVVNALEQNRNRAEKRRAEQALVLFRTLLDRTNDAIEIVDPETGRFLDVNEKACVVHGYTREEYLSLTVLDVEETLSQWPPPAFAELTHKAGFFIVEGRHRRKDGSTFPVEINVNFIHLDRDYIVAVVRDITERKQAEAALKASEERFRRITVNMRDMVGQTDVAGIIQYVTPSNQAILGYRPEEMVGHLVFGFVHPEDRDRAQDMFQTGLATRTPGRGEFRFRHADGHYLWLESVGNILYDDAGQPCGAVLSSRDATERKRVQQQLLLQGAALEAAANSIVLTDRQGTIEWVNKAFSRMTGYAPEEVVGGNPRLLKSGQQDPSYYEKLWNTILAGNVWRGELINRRKDGTLYTDEMTITPVSANGDRVSHFIAIKQDITERKQAEESLCISEAKLSAISTAALDAIAMIDSDGNVIFWNPAAERTLGYSASEIIGKNLHSLLTPQRYKPDFDKGLATFKQTGQGPLVGKIVEVSAVHRDGREFPVEVSLGAIRLDDQWCAVGVLRDISARKQAEGKLLASEERFALAVEGVNDGIWDWDLVSNEVYFSPRYKAMIGYEDVEIEGRYEEWEQRLHPDDRAGTLAKLHDYLEGRSPFYNPEFRLRHKDGSYRWILARAAMVRDASGKPARLTGSHTDITARKKTEEELRASEERFALAVEGTNDGIWDWNIVTNDAYLSPRWKSILGYENHEISNRYEEFHARVHPADLAGVFSQWQSFREGRTPFFRSEFRMRHRDGTYRWVLSRATTVRDAAGNPIRLVGSLSDISDRKDAEEEIRRLNADLEQKVHERTGQLEAANKELEAFAYSVSHDLRAPLRGIDGFSQALLEDYHDKLDADGQDCLRRVRAASQRMGKLIDDILQLSRMTRSTMNRETVDLSAIATRVVAELQAAEPARRVEICVTPGLVANGDARLLEVVLMNLLGNAWKFTSRTENARIEFGATEHEGRHAFFVRDNGAGFDMAHAERLFGAFQRLHSETEFPGTGIGLATVQRIVRRHCGQVWAQAAVDKGATLFFTLGSIEGCRECEDNTTRG